MTGCAGQGGRSPRIPAACAPAFITGTKAGPAGPEGSTWDSGRGVWAHRCHSGLAGLFTNNGVRARPRPLVASAAGEERGPGLVRVPQSPATGGSGWGWHRGSATPRARARRGRRQGAAEAAAPAGGGCAPATAGYWPRARWAGGAGARGGVGGGEGAVTAEGRRGPRVRGCGSAGVSPGCVCSCLALEFVSLHRDVGVCHPEGCLRESLPACLRGGVHLSVYGCGWLPHTHQSCVRVLLRGD